VGFEKANGIASRPVALDYLSNMRRNHKDLIVVGDRVLVHVEEGEERSNIGLYLPPTAVDNQAVQGGKIVATGPGLPMPDPSTNTDEPWRQPMRETRFVPMQARTGDYALFFRKAAVEITFESERYLVVPQVAILALVRDSADDPEFDF
jgi:chaperonin GroES